MKSDRVSIHIKCTKSETLKNDGAVIHDSLKMNWVWKPAHAAVPVSHPMLVQGGSMLAP
jgi:hypothetical protein